jgi:hypothetical protein
MLKDAKMPSLADKLAIEAEELVKKVKEIKKRGSGRPSIKRKEKVYGKKSK